MTPFFRYLEKRDPAQRQSRFYALHLTPTLFGEWALVREWGRIGSPGTVRERWFETREQAQAALARLEAKKRKRGYTPIDGHG